MELNRRHFLAGVGATSVAGAAALAGPLAYAAPGEGNLPPLPRVPQAAPEQLARDEHFWGQIAREFNVSKEFINLENGYFGVMPRRVTAEYKRNIDVIERDNSYFMRTDFGKQVGVIRQRLAATLGCAVEEIAITRGATEALQNLIGGYNKIGPGQVALYSDLDYDSMQYAMEWLKDRRGCTVVKGVIPEPATYDNVLAYYDQLLRDHPSAKLLLLTHVSHRTGLLMPVAEITAMAEARGVDVIIDAAHSWGQVDFKAGDLKAPFVGYNLHKWIGAPLGVGFMYIRKDRLADIDRDYADQDYPATDIGSRTHTGTVNSANLLSVDVALDLHDALGAANKFARMQYLRDRWVHQVREIARLQVLTPEDKRMYAALTSFRVEGRTTKQDTTAITDWLMKNHKIFTVRRGGVTRGEVVRVTPGLYNTPADSDALAKALRELVKVF